MDEYENEFKEELIFDKKVAGTIFFNTKFGAANVVFKELKGDYKKKKAEEKKKDDDKKEGDKKEGDKKDDDKKEEKKDDDKKKEEKK